MSGEVDVPEKAHAELGASVSSRWMNCPGSIQLARRFPQQESSVFAEAIGAPAAVGDPCPTDEPKKALCDGLVCRPCNPLMMCSRSL